MTGRCQECGEDVPLEEVLNHLRVLHPDVWGDGPERAPDGSCIIRVVRVPRDIRPEDFNEQSR